MVKGVGRRWVKSTSEIGKTMAHVITVAHRTGMSGSRRRRGKSRRRQWVPWMQERTELGRELAGLLAQQKESREFPECLAWKK